MICRLSAKSAVAEAAQQVLLHDIQMLKHGALGFGHVALLDGVEDMLVPTMRHLMALGAHGFYLGVIE